MAMCQCGTIHQNKVMNELLFLVHLKLARFLPRIKAKTLSSVCNVPKDNYKDRNNSGYSDKVVIICPEQPVFGDFRAEKAINNGTTPRKRRWLSRISRGFRDEIPDWAGDSESSPE